MLKLTRETELARNRAEQEKQSYLRHDCEGLRPPAKDKGRKHGTKACGEGLSKTAGESMWRGESLSQTDGESMGRGESLSKTAGESMSQTAGESMSQTARRVPPVQKKKQPRKETR
jgi:hypothetical protein